MIDKGGPFLQKRQAHEQKVLKRGSRFVCMRQMEKGDEGPFALEVFEPLGPWCPGDLYLGL